MALREVIIPSTLPQFREWFIIGATSVEQIVENLGALELKLTTEVLGLCCGVLCYGYFSLCKILFNKGLQVAKTTFAYLQKRYKNSQSIR